MIAVYVSGVILSYDVIRLSTLTTDMDPLPIESSDTELEFLLEHGLLLLRILYLCCLVTGRSTAGTVLPIIQKQDLQTLKTGDLRS